MKIIFSIFFRLQFRLKKCGIFFILFFFCHFYMQAQSEKTGIKGNGKISATIIDSVSGEALQYAAIGLSTQSDAKIINEVAADEKGKFEFTNLADGYYKLTVTFFGYKIFIENNIVINSAHSSINLHDIKLSKNQVALKTVTVSGEKSLIENKIDKMVYNAEQDVSSQSGVATDVLRKVPQISVDPDGNVELQGSASVRFLINGKPSTIFGNNITDVLQSIPANQIKSIEVITSPGAKYDAEGTGGIINIILKKNDSEGINGILSLSVGTRLENGSFNLNVHHKKFSANFFVSGNGSIPLNTSMQSQRVSESANNIPSATLLQNGTGTFTRNGIESGIGFDFQLTDKDDISASGGFDFFDHNTNGTNTNRSTTNDVYGNPLFANSSELINESDLNIKSVNAEIDYKRTFTKKDQELDVSVQLSQDINYSHYAQTQSPISPDSTAIASSYGNNPGKDKEAIIAIDYVQPFKKDFLIETGAKATFDQINSTSDVYLLNNLSNEYFFSNAQSSSLIYNSNVYAAYVSGTYRLFNFLDTKTGLRYEYTLPNVYFSNSGTVILSAYGTIVPSAVFSHEFAKHQTLKLSYTHRIERPDYRDLNPFIDASNPENITTGNTALHPEVGDKIEFGYLKIFGKGITLNATLFYRGNKNDIQSYTQFYSTYTVGDSTYKNVSVSSRQNVGRENNYGLNIFISIPVDSKISLSTNISGFQRYIINGALPGNNVEGFNYRINLNATYKITPTFTAEVFGFFNSPRVNAQGIMPSFSMYTFAIRKQFFDKKVSIALTATDLFTKYLNQQTQLTGVNFTESSERQLYFRSFGINLTYKFGKLKFKKDEQQKLNQQNIPLEN